MPRETVQYPRTDTWSGTEMTVHWNKEGGFVQIGVTRHVWTPPKDDAVCSTVHGSHGECSACSAALPGIKAERKRLQESSQPEMQMADSSDAPPTGALDEPATVFTDVMSRDEINRMIRALRRARDQAYGADA